jgi:hypothetical protein
MLWIADMRSLPYGSGCAAAPALLLAFLLGCSTASSGTTTPVAGSPDALASQLAMAFCAATSGCGGVSPDASVRDGSVTATAVPDGGMMSTCVERATLATSQQLALVTTAFGEGLLTIDPTVATTCVDAYASSSCAALAGQTEPDVQAALDNPVCAKLFIGYIPAGERCDMTAECVSGSYCLSQGNGQNVTSIAGAGTLGVCFPFQGMAGACNMTDDCLPPLTCNAATLTCE